MTHGIKAAAVILMATFIAGSVFAQTPGATVYNTCSPKCSMCHGADGLAATPSGKAMKVLSFKDPAMIKATDARFFTSTKEGKGKMLAYKGKLTDQQIKDVIAYIRTLQK